jgi:hypothetical protein
MLGGKSTLGSHLKQASLKGEILLQYLKIMFWTRWEKTDMYLDPIESDREKNSTSAKTSCH